VPHDDRVPDEEAAELPRRFGFGELVVVEAVRVDPNRFVFVLPPQLETTPGRSTNPRTGSDLQIAPALRNEWNTTRSSRKRTKRVEASTQTFLRTENV
jgi:hypothetical protein